MVSEAVIVSEPLAAMLLDCWDTRSERRQNKFQKSESMGGTEMSEFVTDIKKIREPGTPPYGAGRGDGKLWRRSSAVLKFGTINSPRNCMSCATNGTTTWRRVSNAEGAKVNSGAPADEQQQCGLDRDPNHPTRRRALISTPKISSRAAIPSTRKERPDVE